MSHDTDLRQAERSGDQEGGGVDNRAPIEKAIDTIRGDIDRLRALAEQDEIMLRSAVRWIRAACRENPKLLPPLWVDRWSK